ncbi:tRNA(Ile)-lysidine synthase [Parasponia andersonii]|uniref:tRNA(Ile)-lysidine synthetase n=1 Tax=Parasponia andersonii TaxID=3476 RepID=A0A2P5BP59_PARAD|nr:tRNA(Ile)-lysidine synthase [Parasponia andersonii]
MARGLILSLRMETRAFANPTFLRSIPILPLSIYRIPFLCYRHYRHLRHSVPSPRCFSHCASSSSSSPPTHDAIDMNKYQEAFSRRMAMAGLKPHHRVALGVSGGPDSMALCVLAAHWKTNGLNTNRDSDGFINGLLAIIVDHGLRAESKEEANIVSRRVSTMGIRCEIARCEWLDGRPKQGHLQEAARDMRYQHFQKVCIQNGISVLLVAHHADDQAELFVLRLSRNSSVLGLAGMPFVSEIFSSYTHTDGSKDYGILLVRPLLDFSKEDMYKICEGGEETWVEDPTNQSLLYARNRIRMSLRDCSSNRFNSELQEVISACQQTRLYVDNVCSNLINKAITIMDLGYAVIDLEILNQSKIEDICLSKFLALILRFVSQRNRPIRGSTSKLVLDYMHTFPCRTSLTAAGCYLCPAPASRGTKVLVCSSVDCPLPPTNEFLNIQSYIEHQYHTPNDIEQIVADSKLCLGRLFPDASEVHFLDTTSESVLTEARSLGMLSESTYKNILQLQSEEVQHFRSRKKVTLELESKHTVKSISSYSEPLRPGQICSFMNRFFVTWRLSKEIPISSLSEESVCRYDLTGGNLCCHYNSCVVNNDMVAKVRHMNESDWLYLADLLKSPTSENFRRKKVFSSSRVEQAKDMTDICLDHARVSAQKALQILKSIPAAARRGLPVLVNGQGLLLSIPNIGFEHCPRLDVAAVFKPRVPLGGGHSLFI